jgi:hypothetical protein
MRAADFEETRPGRSPRFVSALSFPLLCIAVLVGLGLAAWVWRVWL